MHTRGLPRQDDRCGRRGKGSTNAEELPYKQLSLSRVSVKVLCVSHKRSLRRASALHYRSSERRCCRIVGSKSVHDSGAELRDWPSPYQDIPTLTVDT